MAKVRRALKRLVLTERDLRILQFVFEQKIVSRAQVNREFFAKASKQAAHRRLQKLCWSKYLKQVALAEKGFVISCFELTQKGVQTVAKNLGYPINTKAWRSDALRHDLALVDLRQNLQALSMVKAYYSENILRSLRGDQESLGLGSFANLRSDAAIVIETHLGSFHVAVELELSLKLAQRYRRKLMAYYLDAQVAGVFYVCGSAKIQKLIRQVDAEFSPEFTPKVYTCLNQSGEDSETSWTFTNQKGDSITLK